MSVRTHNETQFNLMLAGGEPDFIDVEAEKAMTKIAQENKNDAEVMGRDILEKTLQEKRLKNNGKS